MTRTWILFGIAAIVLGMLAIGSALRADPEPSTPKDAEAFPDIIIVISSKSSASFGSVLDKVQVRNLGGRAFLVGTSVDTGAPGEWAKGRRTWFPLDDVGQIVEFTNVEQLKSAQSNFKLQKD